jgi:hypothetical protein
MSDYDEAAPIEGEYQPPEEIAPEPAVEETPSSPEIPTKLLSSKSSMGKYVTVCSCGVRFDMDNELANRILTDPVAYDEMLAAHAGMAQHLLDVRDPAYDGPTPSPVHPGHNVREFITVPASPPSGYVKPEDREGYVAPAALTAPEAPYGDEDKAPEEETEQLSLT